MLLPYFRQLDEIWIRLFVIVQLALPSYLLMGILLARNFVGNRPQLLKYLKPLFLVPMLLLVFPALTVLYQWAFAPKFAVLFALLYLFSFVLVGLREHSLFYDCAFPFEISRGNRWSQPLTYLQIFWWLQAPAAAFNGLNWPRGLLWTQIALVSITGAILLFHATADSLEARRNR